MQLRLSFCYLFLAVSAVTALAVERAQPRVAILHGNDDGFGAAYLRAFYHTLKDAGYTNAISAPANDQSGSGSFDSPAKPLSSASDYGFLPAGAAANGTDPNDGDSGIAIKFGTSTGAPAVLGGQPGLVVTGINHGPNYGLATLISGTVGAANEAVSEKIPAIAFSAPGDQRSYLSLTSDDVAYTYSKVAMKLVDTVLASGTPYLPDGVGLNVNFNDGTSCSPDSYVFVLSRINWNPFSADVQQCGSTHLPTESSVGSGGACRASISVFGQGSKMDVDASQQQAVRDKLSSILTCV